MHSRDRGTCPPQVSIQNDIVVGFSTTQTQVHPKYGTTLKDVEYILEFEEGRQMVDIKRSLEQMKTGWVCWYKCNAQLQELSS